MEIFLEWPTWAEHIMNLYSFRANHQHAGTTLEGLNSNAIAHFSSAPHHLITWLSSLHQDPASPHPILLSLHSAPYSHLTSWCLCSKQVPPCHQWFLTSNQAQPHTTVLYSLFEVFFIFCRVLCPPQAGHKLLGLKAVLVQGPAQQSSLAVSPVQ